MIKDIIHKFLLKKEREEAGIFDEQGEDQKDTETDGQTIDEDNANVVDKQSSTSRASSPPNVDGMMFGGGDAVRVIGREMLIALLQKSILETVIVPLRFLELLKWKKVATTQAIANTAKTQATKTLAREPIPLRSVALSKAQSSSLPFERKFKKASIVIGAVNYDDETSDDGVDGIATKPAAVLRAKLSPINRRMGAWAVRRISKKSKKRLAAKFAAPSSAANKKAVADLAKKGTAVAKGKATASKQPQQVVPQASALKKGRAIAATSVRAAQVAERQGSTAKTKSGVAAAKSMPAVVRKLPALIAKGASPTGISEFSASSARAVQRAAATNNGPAIVLASVAMPAQQKAAATKKLSAVDGKSVTIVAKSVRRKVPSAHKISAIIRQAPTFPAKVVQPRVTSAKKLSVETPASSGKAVQLKVFATNKFPAITLAPSAKALQPEVPPTKKVPTAAPASSVEYVKPKAAVTKSLPAGISETPTPSAKAVESRVLTAKQVPVVVGEALASSVRPIAGSLTVPTKVKPVVARPKVASTKKNSHIDSAASPVAAAVTKLLNTRPLSATLPLCAKSQGKSGVKQNKSILPQQQSLPTAPIEKQKVANIILTKAASDRNQLPITLSTKASAPMVNKYCASTSLTVAPIAPPTTTSAPTAKKRQRNTDYSKTSVAPPSKKRQLPSHIVTTETNTISDQEVQVSLPPESLSEGSTSPAAKKQKIATKSSVSIPISETSSTMVGIPSSQRVTPLSSEKTPIATVRLTPPPRPRQVIDKQLGNEKSDGANWSPPLLEHTHRLLQLGGAQKANLLKGKQQQQQGMPLVSNKSAFSATTRRNAVSLLQRVEELRMTGAAGSHNSQMLLPFKAVAQLQPSGSKTLKADFKSKTTAVTKQTRERNSPKDVDLVSQSVHDVKEVNTKSDSKERIKISRQISEKEWIPSKAKAVQRQIRPKSPSWPSNSDRLKQGSPSKVLQDNDAVAPTTPKTKAGSVVVEKPKKMLQDPLSLAEFDNSDESHEGEKARKATTMEKNSANKRKRKAYMMKQLEEHVAPGILSTCHKPKLFPRQLHLKRSQAQEVAGLLLEQLRDEMPQHAEEIPLLYRASEKLKKGLPNCIISPDRCERGYYKSHLDNDFVDSFQNAMPGCIKIKSAVSKKGIAFISTIAATLSHTHYDQDTSFLLILTGTKEIFYAPPSMGTLIRTDNPVISHSSNFEGVNPFVELTGTSWRFAKLNAGDGLLLPQGWLHAVKSLPGTVGISFQVEAAGIDATSPFLRRTRDTAPEDIRHLSHIELEEESRADSTKTRHRISQPLPDFVAKGIANSHLTFKKSLTSITKPAERERGNSLTFKMPVAIKKGLAMAPQFLEAKHTLKTSNKPSGFKKGFRRSFSKPVRPETLFLDEEPEKATATSANKYLDKAPRSVSRVVGLLTRKACGKKRASGKLRRSSREKLICGVLGCGRDPSMYPSMWVMVLSMETSEARLESALPTVPTSHPKHLICNECCETRQSGVILPEEVLNNTDRVEIKGWEEYMYYSSSKVDYQKWANHDGESGKLLSSSLL